MLASLSFDVKETLRELVLKMAHLLNNRKAGEFCLGRCESDIQTL